MLVAYKYNHPTEFVFLIDLEFFLTRNKIEVKKVNLCPIETFFFLSGAIPIDLPDNFQPEPFLMKKT